MSLSEARHGNDSQTLESDPGASSQYDNCLESIQVLDVSISSWPCCRRHSQLWQRHRWHVTRCRSRARMYKCVHVSLICARLRNEATQPTCICSVRRELLVRRWVQDREHSNINDLGKPHISAPAETAEYFDVTHYTSALLKRIT